MQRIRPLRGDMRLSITDDTDVFSFHQGDEEIHISLRESAVMSSGKRVLRVIDKDNIRDFGEWFARRPTTSKGGNFICGDGPDRFHKVSAITQERPILDPRLASALDMAALTIAWADELLGPDPERPKPSIAPEILAVEHGLEIPNGHVTTLFANLSARDLIVTFDETRYGYTMPIAPAQKLGSWIVENLDTIPHKSLFA